MSSRDGEHRVVLRVAPTTGSSQLVMMPVGAEDQPEEGRAEGEHDHRDGHGQRRLVRVLRRPSQRFSPWKVMKNRRDM